MASYDVGIIGSGPAGLTAAATLARQLHTAIVFSSDVYRNSGTAHIHTVPGWEHKDPQTFRDTSRKQIEQNYSTIRFIDVGVAAVEKKGDGGFEIMDEKGERCGVRKVVLAVGSSDVLPEIEGYNELWKKKIFHCLFCLGYEERGAECSGVLAVQTLAMMPPLAIHMADNAAQLSKEVTIFTNGSEEVAGQIKAAGANSPFLVDSRLICRLTESNGGVKVEFADGSSKQVSFLTHNPLTTPQGPFVDQLGLKLSPTGDIQADAPLYQTSCRGVFAAGDCISPFKVIPQAIASGNFAAVAAATQLQAEKYNHASMV